MLAQRQHGALPGPHPVVPYTVGQSATEATTALQRAGYPAVVRPAAGPGPAGRVVGQTPQGNVAPATPVTLFVSPGQ